MRIYCFEIKIIFVTKFLSAANGTNFLSDHHVHSTHHVQQEGSAK